MIKNRLIEALLAFVVKAVKGLSDGQYEDLETAVAAGRRANKRELVSVLILMRVADFN